MDSSEDTAFNPRGGRPKKSPDQVQRHRLQFYVTPDQLKEVEEGFAASGCRTMSAYLAKQYFSKGKQGSVNPIRVLDSIDAIGTEVGRIGNNINQIARYANASQAREKFDPLILARFEEQMILYNKTRKALTLAYRRLIQVLK